MKRKNRPHNKGIWASLTINYVASMLGCHYHTARKLLLEKKAEVNRELIPFDIGDLVYIYRDRKAERLLKALGEPDNEQTM